ncbi:MAG: hypothetical protein KGS61_13635 [Verrucomicrobia bacterium]|nr:hypothetical protein [Verrucomicrobiota bacterium]
MMKSAPEDFTRLRRLLRCMRYEQPPPGYFEDLAERISVRLEAARPGQAPAWWERWVGGLELKPVLAGACALAVCGLLLLGISAAWMGLADPVFSGQAAVAPTSLWSAHPGLFPVPPPLATASLSSMAPVVKQPSSTLVEGSTEYELTPVSFSFRIR